MNKQQWSTGDIVTIPDDNNKLRTGTLGDTQYPDVHPVP